MDWNILFFSQKNETPSKDFEVFRGLNDHRRLGEIITFNQSPYLTYWLNDTVNEAQEPQVSVCNMINGTDASIFAPLVDTNKPIYALNTDVCRWVIDFTLKINMAAERGAGLTSSLLDPVSQNNISYVPGRFLTNRCFHTSLVVCSISGFPRTFHCNFKYTVWYAPTKRTGFRFSFVPRI